MNTATTFGPALRGLRQTLGLSQLALATRLSSTQRHISFLETGRSQITSDFLQRLMAELNLSALQRSALFEASGYRNPYPAWSLASQEMNEALDTIERRILQNWPFPAFALDRDWTVLRANGPAKVMFGAFGADLASTGTSLLTVVLDPAFRAAIVNWEEASLGFYFRLQHAATRNDVVKDAFETAKTQGVFDHIPSLITGAAPSTPLRPVIMGLPNGAQLELAPLVGHLATVQDVRLEAVEIELMVPLDDTSEAVLSGLNPV
ncbi:MAG: helix-turn-helix domain-containing protein [Pseudomonadota bacterium]